MNSESQLQADFFFKIASNPFFAGCIWATPNGIFLGKNNWAQKKLSKNTGTVAGVWDLILHKNNKWFFIEVKFRNNNLTKEQIKFKQKRIENGVPENHFFVFRTEQEGDEVIKKITELCNN